MSLSKLTRQSLLVTGVCVTADVLAFVLQTGVTAVGPRWIAVLIAIVAADAALATRTRWSAVVAGLAVAVNAGGAALLGGPESLKLNEAGVLVAAYRTGAWLRGSHAVAALVVVIAGLVLAHLTRGYPFDAVVAVAATKIGLVSWLVGRYTTARRAHLDELRRRSELQERDARDAVDRAVTEDRAAIARDLHDVVTHHVSAVSMHAGAARLRLSQVDGDPATLASLRSAEESSRSALGDLRDMLDVLHGHRPPDQPGLADLDGLLHGFRAADLPVRLEVTGTPSLPTAIDTALYRVVQEMLTNALRHGGTGAITVTVRHSPGAVDLETINPHLPTGTTPPEPGRGLTGMQNRVGALGGHVRSGPRPDGRTWSTAVHLDLPEQR
jgi:signal transduction histidine kinase